MNGWVAFFGAWTALSFLAAPVIGRMLARAAAAQTTELDRPNWHKENQ